MNILTLLKEDHQKVSKILEQLADTSEKAVKTRQSLFEELVSNFKLHEQIEEKIFYPALKKHAKTKELTLEAYQEHHVADLLIEELESTDFDNEKWKAKFTVLKENIEHHVDEEENKLFPKVKEVLEAERLKEMGNDMLAMKEEATSE